MSSNGGTSGGWGVGQGATNIDTLSVDSADSSRSTPSDEMKRTAAKQLIERYFFQLTDGCGESQCSNPNCRSSKHFRFEPLNGNRAAVQALELFKEHAQLCDSKSKPPKVAKIPADEQASSSSMSSGTENSTAISTNSSGSSEKTVSKVKEKPSSSVPKDTPYLDESKIVEMIEEGERSGSWLKLIRSLGMIYHSSDSLMRSFQKEKLVTLSHEFSPECKSISSVVDSVGVEKMDSDQSEVVEKSEGDSAISVGSLGESMDSQEDDNNDVDLSSVTIAKPEKSRTTDTVLNELDVDFDSLRRSYKKLFSVSNLPFNNALINAILSLSRTLEIDLKYHQAYERNPKLLEVFVIVMEIPELSSPEYIDAAFPAFCKTAGALPIEALARLAKIWSEFSEDKLRCMLQSLHQMITVRVLVSQWGRIQCVNDDDAIAGATKLMKCIYYASIMAGKIDPEQIIEAERELALNADDGLQDFFQGTSPREPKKKKVPTATLR